MLTHILLIITTNEFIKNLKKNINVSAYNFWIVEYIILNARRMTFICRPLLSIQVAYYTTCCSTRKKKTDASDSSPECDLINMSLKLLV
jgi:hypothetical protein